MVIVISDFWQDVFNFKFINVKLVVYCAVVEIDFFSFVCLAGEACGGENELSFSKLRKKGNEDNGNAPIFHTGSGKSVVLKQSSIAKALSVLGDDDGYSGNPGNCFSL